MRREAVTPSARDRTLALVVCTVLAATLMLLPGNARILVADRLGRVLTAPYWSVRTFFDDMAALRRENTGLQQELALRELQAQAAARGQRDVERLAGPALEAGFSGDLVPCRVVMRQSARFATMIKIRSAEPVDWEPWLPVISRQGYLGRLKAVISPLEAWVELMSSPDFALGVEFPRTGLLGILRPRADRFVVEMVGRDEDVQPEEMVITSGVAEIREDGSDSLVGAATPRGFPVGSVAYVASPNDQVFLDIGINPLATCDFNETVFVVLPLAAAGPAGGTVWP